MSVIILIMVILFKHSKCRLGHFFCHNVELKIHFPLISYFIVEILIAIQWPRRDTSYCQTKSVSKHFTTIHIRYKMYKLNIKLGHGTIDQGTE